MCTFIHWIPCGSAGLPAAPPSWKGALARVLGAPCTRAASTPGAEFPAPGSRVALRSEARQAPSRAREGGGEASRCGPLIVLRAGIVSPFRHLRFLSLSSKVTANFRATHTSHKRSGNGALRATGGSAAPALGRPPPATPRATNQSSVGGAGNSPVCCGAAGRAGAPAEHRLAGRGVERATFTGPRAFAPAGLAGSPGSRRAGIPDTHLGVGAGRAGFLAAGREDSVSRLPEQA